MEEQAIQKVYEYLNNAKSFYIATTEGNQPRVRPFGFVMLFQNRLYFSTTCEKMAYRQMLDNPQVEICIIGKDGTWLRLAGTVVFDGSEEVRAAKKAASPHLDKLYEGGADNPIFRLFYLKDCDARLYRMKGETVQYRF